MPGKSGVTQRVTQRALRDRPLMKNAARPLCRGAARVVLVAACSLATVACGSESSDAADAPGISERPPNLVLISLDNLGAAHVGAYGAPRETTPFLDGLARQGVLFESAQSQATWTLPSHASMLSSRTVGGHGVWKVERRFPDAPSMLPEVLAEAGWGTAAFTSCDFVSELYGLDRGFLSMQTVLAPAEKITPRVLEFLPELDDGPFLLFLHYYDVHQPFTEPNPYGPDFSVGLPADEIQEAKRIAQLLGRDPADLDESEITWLSERFPGLEVRKYVKLAREAGTGFDDRLMKYVYQYLAEQGEGALDSRKARYDNGVANMDYRLAELFAGLEQFAWFEDTVFVITSDHGESFNDPPGIMGHGGPPYREQTHVPLIVFGRGIPAGVRVADPVGSIDIAPTLLELAGVAAPDDFQGQSFAAVFGGGAVEPRPVLSGELKVGSVAVSAGDWRLFVGQDRDQAQLFDTREASRLDLGDQHPDVVTQLKHWLRGAEQRNTELTADMDPSDVQLDEETRARLKALGYLR